MPKSEPRQINARLPEPLYTRLRQLSYELHKSQTKIITEALVLYDDVVKRRRAREAEEARSRAATPAEEVADA